MGNPLTPARLDPHRNLGLTSGQQWGFLAATILLAWVFWPEPVPTPQVPASERTNWDGFLAIAYGGICDQPGGRNITPARFREQVEALAAAGYRPISFDEAQAFLLEGAPLPERAILLTFDDGRKDTAEEAEAVLGRLRFPATFFLRLEPIERSDRFFATWHALRALAATGRWWFGSKGYDAFDRIHTETGREAGLFLTSHAYLPAEGRSESEEEWKGRVERDIALSGRILAERIPGWRPTAFAFPCSDDGRLLPDGGVGLRGIVSRTFPLCFARTGYGFNHWRADARRLTRLVVSPEWTGQDLVRWLDSQGPRRAPFEAGSERDWVLRHGSVSVAGDSITCEPLTGRGSEAWLAGTEHWRCVQGRVSIETRPDAQAWLYLRGQPGRSFLRLGWTGERIEIQSRSDGEVVRFIARGTIPDGITRTTLSFELTDRRIRFSLNDGTAPRRSFPVPVELDGGMAGLGAWLLEGGQGPVRFEGLRLEARLARGQLVDTIEEVRALARDGACPVDVIAPRWYRTERSTDGLHLAGGRDPALVHLAAYLGASVWPVVRLDSLPDAASIPALAIEIDRAASGAGAGGMILDLRVSPPGGELPDPERVKALVASTSTSLGIIPARGVGDILGVVPLEKLDWIGFLEPPSAEVSPERVLLLEEPGR